MITSAKTFIEKYGKAELSSLLTSITTWQTYAEGQEKEIDTALHTLFSKRTILSQVMDLRPTSRLYRGIAVRASDPLSGLAIGELFTYRQPKFAESWASYKSAYSFAASKEWHDSFGGKDVGIVLALLYPQQATTILAPAHRTVKWFEQLIESQLPPKQKSDRQTEDEYLVKNDLVKSIVVKKISLSSP